MFDYEPVFFIAATAYLSCKFMLCRVPLLPDCEMRDLANCSTDLYKVVGVFCGVFLENTPMDVFKDEFLYGGFRYIVGILVSAVLWGRIKFL